MDYGGSKVKWTRERAQGGTGLGMSSPLRFFFAPPPSRPPVDTQPAEGGLLVTPGSNKNQKDALKWQWSQSDAR